MVNQNIGNFIVAHPESPVNENLNQEIGLAISEEKASPLLDSGNQIESLNNDKMDLKSDSNVMQYHPDDEENNLRNIIISSGTAISDYNADQGDQRNKNFLTQHRSDCEVDLTLSEPSPNKLHVDTSKLLRGTSENSVGGSQTSDKDVCRACEAQFLVQYEPVSPLQHILPQGGADEAAPTTEPKSENKARNDDSLAARAILKKMEFSAENDLPNLVRTEALEQTSERPAWENSIPLQKFPTKSWMDLYKKKGKGKVLSDGDESVRFLNDEEDSHENVESCNSTGSSAKSKRRFNPAESINDSKRGEREPEDKPDFTSAIRHNSSFMNWISNIVKGYREGPSLDLSLDNSDWQKQNVQEIITCNKHSDDGCVGAGFQAMFQSLYVPASRKPNRRVSEAEYYKEASDQLVLANSRSDKILALTYPSDAATSGNLVLPSQLQLVPVNSEPLQKVHETNCRSYKGGSRFFGSLSKQSYGTPAKRSPYLLSESKTVNDKTAKKSTLDSLWITRFCAKNATTFLNLDERNQNENRGDTNPSRINNIQVSSEVHSTKNAFGIRENFIHKECEDLQKHCETLSGDVESTPHKEFLQHNHQNTHKSDVISPCAICKSPDEIASIFARRLDALKQISLAGTKGGTSSQMATCLFCGKHGHEIRYCSDTTESELEALLCIASTHASVEGSCFCIICFQLDHWANTCPRNSTRRKQVLGTYNSVGNLNVKLDEGDGVNSISLKKREGDPLYIAKRLNIPSSKAHPVCAEIDSKTWTGKCNFCRRMSDSNRVRKCMDPKSEGNASKRRKYFPMCNVFGKHMEAVPNGTLDSIKRLRLSRLEILKCMNSQISLSCLNGFYIRLRVGKLEEGQEGTGYYYVASITGEQLEVSAKNSKKYISVNAGGSQSLIGIQYVSNHDFLEDELIAWWCRLQETGEKVPTQEELKSKFEERMKLGFC